MQVLLHALVHGFVRMKQLALLVYDEGMLWNVSHRMFFVS